LQIATRVDVKKTDSDEAGSYEEYRHQQLITVCSIAAWHDITAQVDAVAIVTQLLENLCWQ